MLHLSIWPSIVGTKANQRVVPASQYKPGPPLGPLPPEDPIALAEYIADQTEEQREQMELAWNAAVEEGRKTAAQKQEEVEAAGAAPIVADEQGDVEMGLPPSPLPELPPSPTSDM